MAPFRNFLAKRSAPPSSGESDIYNDGRLSTGAPPTSTSPLSIRKSCENQPPEYKLSVVDDNGAYLPPSPPEKQSIWRRPGSSNNSNHRSLVNENEPFSISRESFDSYRRSFDISARSPVCHSDALPSRTSLDSRFSRMSSPSLQHGSTKKPQTMEEEQFEEVELGADDPKPKKRGIFSRFGDFNSDSQSSKSSTFYFPGRKREQSGAGAEMGAIQSPVSGEGS